VTERPVSARAAKQATDTSPIVLTTRGHPVAAGLMASGRAMGGSPVLGVDSAWSVSSHGPPGA
jgi:hypothetical protein